MNSKLSASLRNCSMETCPSPLSSSMIPKQYRLATLMKSFTFQKLSPIKCNTNKNLDKITLSVKTLAITDASNKFEWFHRNKWCISFQWFPWWIFLNRRLVRLVRIDTPPSGFSSLKVVKKYISLPYDIHESTAQPFRNEYSWIDESYDSWIH